MPRHAIKAEDGKISTQDSHGHTANSEHVFPIAEAGFKNVLQIFDSAIPHKGTMILSYGSFMSHDVITKDVFKTFGSVML